MPNAMLPTIENLEVAGTLGVFTSDRALTRFPTDPAFIMQGVLLVLLLAIAAAGHPTTRMALPRLRGGIAILAGCNSLGQ